METVILCGRLQRAREGGSLVLVTQKMNITPELQAEGFLTSEDLQVRGVCRLCRYSVVTGNAYDGMM